MAVVVNSDASVFKRTANLPAATSFSMWGWFYFGTDRNTYTGLLALADTSNGNPAEYIQLATDVDGTSLRLWDVDDNTSVFATLAPGTWYFGAITCAGTGANQCTAYVRTPTANTFTTASLTLDATDSFTPAVAEWGRDGYTGDYLDGRIHACGMADVALSADELLAISYFHEPQLRGIRSLNVFYPTIESVNSNATVDRSGNGRNATATVGALADAPSLLWGPRGVHAPVPAPAGGAVTGTGAITLDGPTVAGAGVRTSKGTGAISLSGPTVAGTGKVERKGTGSVILSAFEVAGTGERTVTGSGAIVLPLLEVAGSGTVGTAITGSGALTLDELTVAGAGFRTSKGTGNVILDQLTVSGAGVRTAKGTGAITLDVLTVAGAGVRTAKGTGAVSLTPLELAGEGSTFSGVGGSGAITLTPLEVAGTGEVTNTGSGAIVLDALQVSGAGKRTSVGSGAIVLGAFEVSGYDVPPAPTTGYQAINGTAIDQYGRMVTLFIEPDEPAPAARAIEGLLHDDAGRRIVTTWPGSVRHIQGMAVRYDGVQVILPDGPAVRAISGIPIGVRGELAVSTNMPRRAVEGFGLDAQGLLCVTDKG